MQPVNQMLFVAVVMLSGMVSSSVEFAPRQVDIENYAKQCRRAHECWRTEPIGPDALPLALTGQLHYLVAAQLNDPNKENADVVTAFVNIIKHQQKASSPVMSCKKFLVNCVLSTAPVGAMQSSYLWSFHCILFATGAPK
ncbi:unnamed protein product [Enterobius vermicularis]|uniref:Cystatin domain-containing protein n=1 Tax=Enterobius vermicularis TaxID=51028 RepID=A0A0N4VJ10_ENTVE|nr:unnamed protein product [Enterobius vermicularis]